MYLLIVLLRGVYPSEMPYCNAVIGSFSRISAVIFLTSSTGNASGAGFPAAKGITSPAEVAFKISHIAEGLRDEILSENL